MTRARLTRKLSCETQISSTANSALLTNLCINPSVFESYIRTIYHSTTLVNRVLTVCQQLSSLATIMSQLWTLTASSDLMKGNWGRYCPTCRNHTFPYVRWIMFDPKDIVRQRLTNSQDDAHRIGVRIIYELLKDQLHRLSLNSLAGFPRQPRLCLPRRTMRHLYPAPKLIILS
jgi:hypothetical protein